MLGRAVPPRRGEAGLVRVPGRVRVMFREGEGRSRLGGDLAPGSFAEILDQLSRLGFWGLPVESGSGSPASVTVQAGERFWTSRPGLEVAVPRGPCGPAGDVERRSFRAVLDAITLFAALLRRHFIGEEKFLGHVGGDDFFVGISGCSVEDLEAVLVEIARSPRTLKAKDMNALRTRIEENDLLFKVRVVTDEIRERQKTISTVSEGEQ